MPAPLNPAEDLVDDEFPVVYRRLVPAALRRAYASADQALDRLDFLGTPSGKFHRGDLIVLAAEFEFSKLITEGQLPFEPSWESYASPTGKHLVMYSPGAKITLNQVQYPHMKPRQAQFRENMDVSNSEYLFPEWNEARREAGDRKHLLLLHGYHQLSFSNIAVPHPSEHRLIWFTEDLLKLPHQVDLPQAGGEGPVESPDAEVVEEIIKKVRDHE